MGRIQNRQTQSVHLDDPSRAITVSEDAHSLEVRGRCDDGGDEGIVSLKLADRASIQGIGKISVIKPVTLHVTLKIGSNAQHFKFSRGWTEPRTLLHLSSSQIALVNTRLLVSDHELACEDVLIDLRVLCHIQIDTKNISGKQSRRTLRIRLIAQRWYVIGRKGGYVSRIMSARQNSIEEVPWNVTYLYTKGRIHVCTQTTTAPEGRRIGSLIRR